MQINYTEDAFSSLMQLVNYIESTNTLGAGLRWLRRFEAFIHKKLRMPDNIALCNNKTFNQLHLRCIYFNDWVIAFSIHSDFVLVEAMFHKSRVSD